jgi:hypothetical protein
MQMKICVICKKEKPLSSFGKRSRNKDKLDTRCRECALESERLRGRWFDSYKNTCSCIICSENDPVCLDFHHIDPSNKNKIIRNYRFYDKERVMTELAKCICLCSNCHKKFHAHNWTYEDGVVYSDVHLGK